MPFAVPALLKGIPWKIVGIVAGLLFVSFLFWRGDHYKEKAARSDALLGTVTDIANSNAKFNEMKDRKITLIQVELVKGVKKQAGLDKNYAEDVRRIENAATDDECPVGASVREWLNGLPQPESGDADPIQPGSRGSHARYVGSFDAETR